MRVEQLIQLIELLGWKLLRLTLKRRLNGEPENRVVFGWILQLKILILTLQISCTYSIHSGYGLGLYTARYSHER